MIDRRDFIVGAGAAVASPMGVCAQQTQVKRVGLLINGAETDPEMQRRVTAFRGALEQLGWSEGRNLRLECRYSGAVVGRLPELARDLVSLNPDAIFAHTTPASIQLRRETQTIPIVFVNVSDPIGSGLVSNLARPGSNATGFLLYEDGIIGKWLGMLKEIAPSLRRATHSS